MPAQKIALDEENWVFGVFREGRLMNSLPAVEPVVFFKGVERYVVAIEEGGEMVTESGEVFKADLEKKLLRLVQKKEIF